MEFAIVLPLLAMFLLGIVTAGFAYNAQLDLTHATREGARYGATVAPSQSWVSGSWASNVREMVVARSGGDLTIDTVCVSLVHNTSAANTIVYSDAFNGQSWFSTNGTSPCIDDTYDQFGPNDDGLRVQVTGSKPARIELGVFPSIGVTLRSSATARLEAVE